MSEAQLRGHGAFLLEAMTELVTRSKVDVDGYMHEQGNRDAHEFANVVHDKLVEVWTNPQQETDDLPDILMQKAELWDRHRRSQPPGSTQLERVSTPQRHPGAQQISPGTIQRPLEGSTSARAVWDKPGGWNAANRQEQEWANTNTIG